MNVTSLFIGLRYMASRRRNRSVSFIAAIAMTGIVLGVALLITVLSVMNGFDRELRERILSIMPHITLYQSAGGLEDWPDLRERIVRDYPVAGVAPFVELQAMLNAGKHTRSALVYGVEPGLESSVSRINEFLSPSTLTALSETANAIAVGQSLAKALMVSPGDQLTLIVPRAGNAMRTPAIKPMSVIDVFTTGTELDQTLALMGLGAAKRLRLQPDTVSGLHIKTADLFQAPVLAHQLAKQLRSQLGLAYYSSDWTQTHGNIYAAIQMSKNLVSLLLFLIIAIAAFNVVSTLMMVVVDKQGDIAILRTLGVTTGGIMLIFVTQGMLMGVIGTLIGVVLGIALSLSVEALIATVERVFDTVFLQTDIYPISFLPSSIEVSDVVFVALVSVIMSLLSTLYPAWKAARVNPAQALRYDY
ncbi:MAG: lipoprotein-releasing ABC transporter permease subunit [Cellvibrionaceae bacterium]|nr:lipoprotein-releasing ABC transporter permease subunit [Cellvibrionaceae bacterium]